ncbi:MAG: tRNA (adenosine(37)-N6)-threonylcarbamoyltransferase complex dimerization subunit type 1 TsaB [Desulfobacteraceae bacterium]|nr:tRNA (adenosine(37)-N6)-threonylcarbamoyltransferase complex dimerization subunit type 1 TsaB [Desulfobacteraceae bacterium]
MNLLAVDTAGKACSVALMNRGEIRAEFYAYLAQTHARHLMRLIDSVLEVAGIGTDEIEAFGVTTGPGSFTGLRIGIATVKGMAMAHEKPAAGVSTLSVLAYPFRYEERLICSVIDARKGEVYGAVYRTGQNAIAEVRPAFVCPPARLLEKIGEIGEPCLFVGSGAALYRDDIARHLGSGASFAPDSANHIRAGVVAEMAYSRLLRGRGESVFDLVPSYVRKSDAKRKRAEKGKQEPGG